MISDKIRCVSEAERLMTYLSTTWSQLDSMTSPSSSRLVSLKERRDNESVSDQITMSLMSESISCAQVAVVAN